MIGGHSAARRALVGRSRVAWAALLLAFVARASARSALLCPPQLYQTALARENVSAAYWSLGSSNDTWTVAGRFGTAAVPIWREVAAGVCGAVAAALSSAGGIGGGGLYVPIFNLLLGFSSKTSAALSSCMIFGGTIANQVWYARQRHRGTRPLIDYDVALACQPNVLLGISVGVVLNVMSPSWLVTTLLIVTLFYMTLRSCRGAIRRWGAETTAKFAASAGPVPAQQHRENPEKQLNGGGGGGAPAAPPLEMPLLPKAGSPQYPAAKMAMLAVVWLIFLAVQLARGSSDGQNLFGIATCGIVYWVVTLSQVPIAFVLTVWTLQYLNRSPDTAKEELHAGEDEDVKAKPLMRLLPVAALFAGVLGGMLGLGGGMIISPLFLEIGMHPQVAAATCSFMVFFSSSLSVVQFWLLGMIPWEYALVSGALSLVFSIIGLQVIQKVICRYGRVSPIVFSVATVMGISAVLMAFFGSLEIWQDIQQGTYMGFRSPC